MLSHVWGSILGWTSIFGVFAFGAYLASGHAGRLGLVVMVICLRRTSRGAGVPGGIEEFAQLDPGFAVYAQGATFLLLLVGNVLLGVAV